MPSFPSECLLLESRNKTSTTYTSFIVANGSESTMSTIVTSGDEIGNWTCAYCRLDTTLMIGWFIEWMIDLYVIRQSRFLCPWRRRMLSVCSARLATSMMTCRPYLQYERRPTSPLRRKGRWKLGLSVTVYISACLWWLFSCFNVWSVFVTFIVFVVAR